MKKLVLAMVVLLAADGIVSAQNWGANPQMVSVQGTLGLQNGVIALISGNTTYYVPQLSRYVGFIDALKEGAQVRVDGWQTGGGYITPTKLTVGGKDYDLSSNAYGAYNAHGSGYCGNAHGGWGWGHGGGRGWGRW